MPFIQKVRVLFKTRLIFSRINGPTVYSITMFIDIFSYQLCGLTRRIISQPQDTQRSHQVNPTRVTGCPRQTLYTASPSFGNCLYSGKPSDIYTFHIFPLTVDFMTRLFATLCTACCIVINS